MDIQKFIPSEIQSWLPGSMKGMFNAVQKGIDTIQKGMDLKADLKAAPVGKRFEAIQKFGNEMGGDIKGVTDVIAANGNDHFQEALGNALADNERFGAYFVEKITSGDSQTLFSPANFQKILTTPYAANALGDILNTIAKDKSYNFGQIDTLLTDFDAFQDAETSNDPEKQRAARKKLITSIKTAGGNIPALANLDGPMVLSFLGNIVNQGAMPAIDGLINQLNMSPEEAEAFRQLMVPLAPMIEFMAKPYAEYAKIHGPQIMQFAERTMDHIDTVTNGKRITLEEEKKTAATETDVTTKKVTSLSGEDGRAPTKGDLAAAAGSGRPLPGDDKAIRVSQEDRPTNSFNDNASGAKTDGYDSDDLAASTPRVTPTATGPNGMMPAI